MEGSIVRGGRDGRPCLSSQNGASWLDPAVAVSAAGTDSAFRAMERMRSTITATAYRRSPSTS